MLVFYYILCLHIDDEQIFYNSDLICLLISRLSTNLSEGKINTLTFVIFKLFYSLCRNSI